MIEYKCVTRHLEGGMFSEPANKVDDVIQPMLDAGAGAGWTLHSFTTSGRPDGDLTLVSIWQRERLQD